MWEMGEGGRVPPVAHYPGWIEQSSSRGAMIKSLAPTIYERRLVAPKERRGPPKEKKDPWRHIIATINDHLRTGNKGIFLHNATSSGSAEGQNITAQCEIEVILLSIEKISWKQHRSTKCVDFTEIFAKYGESKILQFPHCARLKDEERKGADEDEFVVVAL